MRKCVISQTWTFPDSQDLSDTYHSSLFSANLLYIFYLQLNHLYNDHCYSHPQERWCWWYGARKSPPGSWSDLSSLTPTWLQNAFVAREQWIHYCGSNSGGNGRIKTAKEWGHRKAVTPQNFILFLGNQQQRDGTHKMVDLITDLLSPCCQLLDH